MTRFAPDPPGEARELEWFQDLGQQEDDGPGAVEVNCHYRGYHLARLGSACACGEPSPPPAVPRPDVMHTLRLLAAVANLPKPKNEDEDSYGT